MHVSIKSTLLALFAPLAVVSIGQGIAGLSSLGVVRDKVADITMKQMPSVDAVRQIQTTAAEARVFSYRYQALKTNVDRAMALRKLAEVDCRMQALLTGYQPLITSSEGT